MRCELHLSSSACCEDVKIQQAVNEGEEEVSFVLLDSVNDQSLRCRQARGEGLTLLPAKTKTGYFGVNLDESRKAKPFGARVRLG